ncbi:hypothetical protein R1sor_025979 [Riccia sorocarpa]|uniref:Uncharacterized protein n=1 Tax=Riccia sorocarpa TaxID=122646 RepID=A0ABD3GDT0_9MARC
MEAAMPNTEEQVISKAASTKRRPGCPPGTRNRKLSQATLPSVPPPKKRPGRPPGSKNLKQTAKKMKPATVNSQPLSLKSPARKRKTPPKRMELSITISIAGADVSPRIFPSVQSFLHNECEAGIFAVERGGSLLNLDLQGVIAMVCTSPLEVKKRLTAAVGWAETRPIGAGICVKNLTNKGIHTFIGMVVFVEYWLTVYTPATSWLINKGMDLTRMTSLWKAYIQPGTINMADVKNIFFWMQRLYPSRFVEGVHPGLQILKTSVLEDMRDSNHSDFQPERVSGNSAVHTTSFASFIPLVPGMQSKQIERICISRSIKSGANYIDVKGALDLFFVLGLLVRRFKAES